jgi:TetR/AcrR family transcriptional regulator
MKHKSIQTASAISGSQPPAPGHRKRVSKRREQQRSIATRLAIVEAALAEFAEKGYEGATTRCIAKRAGMQHPLVTYHYPTKDILWRAVGTYCHATIRKLWQWIPRESNLTPLERVREEFRAVLRFSLEHPHFHLFMVNENRPGSPRLAWLVKNVLSRNVGRVLPQIRAAQKAGDLPAGEPILIHYMLIGITSVLSSLGPEMHAIAGVSPNDPAVVESYWKLVENLVFNSGKATARLPKTLGPRARRRTGS